MVCGKIRHLYILHLVQQLMRSRDGGIGVWVTKGTPSLK